MQMKLLELENQENRKVEPQGVQIIPNQGLQNYLEGED